MFKFKHFNIRQDEVTMKVNTDGVLLGAITKAQNPKNIIDIGTGTGIIAIMMAQKFENSKIIGVEIDKKTAQQAKENAQNCKWNNRITIKYTDFIEFATKTTQKFDIVISNPPFFQQQLQTQNPRKNIAKHSIALPFHKLIEATKKIITKNGKFTVIIPYTEKDKFNSICEKNKLFINKQTIIFPTENKPPNRIILEYINQKNQKNQKNIDKIFIRNNQKYTKKYLSITKNFYLFEKNFT